jgi:hypothetical protein
MKRVRLLVLLGAIAIALPLGLLHGVASATGGDGSSLSINQNAQFDLEGGIIHVGLRARCPASSLPGTIEVHVTQDPPESVAHAEGDSLVKEVVCDGQTHTVGASILNPVPPGFDAGRAYAEAKFLLGGTAKTARWINIIVMPG